MFPKSKYIGIGKSLINHRLAVMICYFCEIVSISCPTVSIHLCSNPIDIHRISNLVFCPYPCLHTRYLVIMFEYLDFTNKCLIIIPNVRQVYHLYFCKLFQFSLCLRRFTTSILCHTLRCTGFHRKPP